MWEDRDEQKEAAVPGPSAIEWTQVTWNPVTGCDKVSPGCAHCYAETFAERWRGIPGHAYEQGFDLRLWPERLGHPLRWKKPRIIFVNSMSDMFHEDVPADYVAEVFDVMARADQHIYQVLTKRHERLAELAPDLPWPPHIWMGVSIENRRFVHRADYLRQVPAAVRFISAEPLLGYLEGLDLTDIDWLIAGGESGPKYRPVKPDWIRYLRDLCVQEEVRFFFKQWGGLRAKAGGRILDGQEWNQMPDHALDVAAAPTGPTMTQPKRPRDIPDDADEKWHYSAHTAAKHEILHRYLGAWIPILGRGPRGNPRLILVDGFAGRGRYMGGEDGSPKIMFDRAVEVVEDGMAKGVVIRAAEPKPKNFEHLRDVCDGLEHEHVEIAPRQRTFTEMAEGIIQWNSEIRRPRPTFVFADPFGFRGVPLDTIRRLMQIDRLEVLLTFMARDMARFLEQPNVEGTLTEFFGDDSWKECADAEDRPACLLDRYRRMVVPDVATFATSFRVFEDERRTVLYYLVHLTNHDLGMREMKDAMVEKSGDMTFWPITIRSPDQLGMDVDEQAPYPSLQTRLERKYAGRKLTFLDLLNDDYPDDNLWVTKQYRAALVAMEKENPPRVTITRTRTTKKLGKPATRGVQEPDVLSFPVASS